MQNLAPFMYWHSGEKRPKINNFSSKIKYNVENNYILPKFRLNPSWMAVLVTSPHCNVDHPKFRTLQWMASHCQIIHTPNQKKPPNQSLQKTTLAMKTLWQTMMPIYVLLGMWMISCYLSKRGLISEKKIRIRISFLKGASSKRRNFFPKMLILAFVVHTLFIALIFHF